VAATAKPDALSAKQPQPSPTPQTWQPGCHPAASLFVDNHSYRYETQIEKDFCRLCEIASCFG